MTGEAGVRRSARAAAHGDDLSRRREDAVGFAGRGVARDKSGPGQDEAEKREGRESAHPVPTPTYGLGSGAGTPQAAKDWVLVKLERGGMRSCSGDADHRGLAADHGAVRRRDGLRRQGECAAPAGTGRCSRGAQTDRTSWLRRLPFHTGRSVAARPYGRGSDSCGVATDDRGATAQPTRGDGGFCSGRASPAARYRNAAHASDRRRSPRCGGLSLYAR